MQVRLIRIFFRPLTVAWLHSEIPVYSTVGHKLAYTRVPWLTCIASISLCGCSSEHGKVEVLSYLCPANHQYHRMIAQARVAIGSQGNSSHGIDLYYCKRGLDYQLVSSHENILFANSYPCFIRT